MPSRAQRGASKWAQGPMSAGRWLIKSPVSRRMSGCAAVALANAAQPDILLLTGDFISHRPADMGPCAHLLAPLCARLGMFAVLGNHDHTSDPTVVERALAHL